MHRKALSSPRGSPARIDARIGHGLIVALAWALPMIPAVRINLDASQGQGAAWTSFAIGSIVFAAVCVEIAIAAVENGRYLRCCTYAALSLLFLTLNIANAIGNAAAHSDHSREDRSSQIEKKQRVARMREQSSQACKAQFDIAGDTTPESIEAELQAKKAADARRWNATGGCDIAKISAGPTREFCAEVARLEAKLAAAKKRDELDAKITELNKQDEGAVPLSIDPFADNIGRFLAMLGYAPGSEGKVLITAARDWGKAVGVELLAAFGPAALLILLAEVETKRHAESPAPKPQKAKQVAPREAAMPAQPAPAAPESTPVTGDDPEMLAFIARRLERCEGAIMKAGELFELWQEDCAGNGIAPGSQKSFSVRLRRFFEHDANNGRPRYRNVQRKTAQPAIRMVVSN
jgi:hypothetical protein